MSGNDRSNIINKQKIGVVPTCVPLQIKFKLVLCTDSAYYIIKILQKLINLDCT